MLTLLTLQVKYIGLSYVLCGYYWLLNRRVVYGLYSLERIRRLLRLFQKYASAPPQRVARATSKGTHEGHVQQSRAGGHRLRVRAFQTILSRVTLVSFCLAVEAAEPGSKEALPFRIIRSKFSNLPVYLDYRNGGTRILTKIRRIDGDVMVSLALTHVTRTSNSSPSAGHGTYA